jgi:amidase
MSVDVTLIDRSAHEIVGLLRREEVSPHDLLDTLASRVEQVEPRVNALPTLCWERAHAHAAALLKRPVAERGLLCGLPVPIKDLTDVAGVRTTRGSTIYAERVPERSDLLVSLLEARGGIVYAKSNTPEFGSGGHTYNSVLGVTRNPWDLSRSA